MKQVTVFLALVSSFVFASSAQAEDPSPSDHIFSYNFPRGGGWYQLQEIASNLTLCETGGPACVVKAGEYSLLTFHGGKVLREIIKIKPDSDWDSYPFTITDDTILFKNDDWYQVQFPGSRLNDWEGRGETPLRWNTVTVINLTTGERFENIQVSAQSEVVEDATTQQAVDQIVLWCGRSIFNPVTEPPLELAEMTLVNREGYLNAESGIRISETVTFYKDNQFMIESYPLDQGFECTELPCTSPSVVIGYTSFSGTYNQNEDVIRFEGIDSTTGSNVTKVYVIRQSKAKPATFELSKSGVCRSEYIKDGY